MKIGHFRGLQASSTRTVGVPREIYSLRTGKGTERAAAERMVSGGGSSYSPGVYIHPRRPIRMPTPAELMLNRPADTLGYVLACQKGLYLKQISHRACIYQSALCLVVEFFAETCTKVVFTRRETCPSVSIRRKSPAPQLILCDSCCVRSRSHHMLHQFSRLKNIHEETQHCLI